MARFVFEPAHVARRSLARHDREFGRAIVDPRRHRSALHEAAQVGIDRDDRKHDPVFGQEKCVHQRIVRHVDDFGLAHFARGIDDIIADLRRPHRTVDPGAQIDQFAGRMIDLWVRRKGRGDDAVIMFLAQRLQRARVELDRGRPLHQREQLAAMNDNVCVRGVVAFALHRRVGGHRVAEHPEQTLARRLFQLEFLGPHPAIDHRGAATLDMKSINHAVAVEPVIVALARRIERFGAVTIKDADQIIGNLALHDQVGGCRLEPHRLMMPRQIGVIEKCFGH